MKRTRRVLFCLLSAASILSNSAVLRAGKMKIELEKDIRFVTDEKVREQIKERVGPIEGSPFEALLSYLPEDKRPKVKEIAVSDEIAMTIDDFLNKVNFTVFFINGKNEVAGSTVVTYKIKEESNVKNLCLAASSKDSFSDFFLSNLAFYSIQYSLNQSEQLTIEEFADSSHVHSLPIEQLTVKNDGKDRHDNSEQPEFELKVKCNLILESDYQGDSECEEED